MTPYNTLCDDFGVYLYLHTKVDLPGSPETVLHFFDTVQKAFPDLTEFDRRSSGEYVLEEDRDKDVIRSVALDARRLASAYGNPETLEEADAQHERVLELAPYHLDLTALNCEALEVMFSFDLVYPGNHDAVIAEALAPSTPLEPLLQHPGAKPIRYEPSVTVALDEKCRLQARMWVESRTTAYQVQSGQFPEAPVSVYLTVNQLWGKSAPGSFLEAYRIQRRLAQELADSYLVPNLLRPLQQTISSK